MDNSAVTGLSYLEDGEFAKIYKGHMAFGAGGQKRQNVVIKVPRVGAEIRKEKSKQLCVDTSTRLRSRFYPCFISPSASRVLTKYLASNLGATFYAQNPIRFDFQIIRTYAYTSQVGPIFFET